MAPSGDSNPRADGARPLRADAARNRRRILDAARRVLASHGLDAGVEVVAREAGVGVGTLYRRFPTKEELVVAVLDDRLTALDRRLAAVRREPDPWTAFAATVGAFAGAVAEDRSLLDVAGDRFGVLPIADRARDVLYGHLGPVLATAQAAGVVREDIVVEDLILLANAVSRLTPWRQRHDPDVWRRMLALVLDGLRAEGAAPLRQPPPRPFTADPAGADRSRAASS